MTSPDPNMNHSESSVPHDDLGNFPLVRLSLKPDDVYKMFDNIRTYKPEFVKQAYRISNMKTLQFFETIYLPEMFPVLLRAERSDYLRMNRISSYFTEDIRIRARRFDTDLCQLDYWKKNEPEVRKTAIAKFGNEEIQSLNDALYDLVLGVGSFRPMVLASMIRRFGSKRILDFSAGWGDRLIAAMACNVDYYYGVDPNSLLHPKYKTIEEFFRSRSQTEVRMFMSPFEVDFDLPLPPKTYTKLGQESGPGFDLVFTSPPYFNLEHYSDESTQSHHYGGLDTWYSKFLIVSVKKAWSLIAEGGYMVLNINDFYNETKYVERLIIDVNRFPDSAYQGVISYAEMRDWSISSSPQPMWIWRKKAIDPDPPITIETITPKNDLSFSVVAEHHLPGGTKQRCWRLFQKIKQRILIYATAPQGAAQIALAIAAKLTGKSAVVFVSDALRPMVVKARQYGATIVEMPKARMHELQAAAEEYAKSADGYAVPFGFDFPEFREEISKQLKEKIPESLLSNLNSEDRTLFCVIGSGTLASILLKLFPKCRFALIVVNKKWTYDEFPDNPRITLYYPVEEFTEQAIIRPPYPSVASYDAKAWAFLIKYGKPGDVVWNVASEVL